MLVFHALARHGVGDPIIIISLAPVKPPYGEHRKKERLTLL